MPVSAVGAVEPDLSALPPTRTTSGVVRLAVIGCGAMTRENLLPVLSGHEGVNVVSLVDVNEAVARKLGDAYGISSVLTSPDGLDTSMVDAVIIATPPAFHCPQTVALAGRGLHVFVEKPMATTLADARQMMDAARRAGVTLTVGLYRRLLPSTRLLRGLLESGLLGAPRSVDIEEGGEYGWPLASLANLTPRLGGGGVLIDIGSHVLDVLQFVLPGDARLVSYADDSRGGVETDSLLSLTIANGGREMPCRVALSRSRRLRNSIRIECERGVLELARGEFATVQVRFNDAVVRDPIGDVRPVGITGAWADEDAPIGYQVFRAEIDDWLTAVRTGAPPVLSAETALETVRLIEDAYRSRTLIKEPWSEEGIEAAPRRLGRRRSQVPRKVLITGASGFIGCRTAEVLALREGCDVRALIRNPSNAARLARLPVEMLSGDILSPDDLSRAMDGCDAVVHCAVGTSWQRADVVKVTVEGTRNVANVATRSGVDRFVHISSMAVHGRVTGPTLDEQTPLVGADEDSYGGDKRRAEDEVRACVARGLRAVILRPARVYGPFGKTFSTRPLQHLSRGTMALSGPYDGPSSMVYVDNVVESILRALDAPDELVGEAFHITDPEQLSWREFYQYFADACGTTIGLVAEAPAAAEAAPVGWLASWKHGIREIVMSPELRGFARRCLQTDPIGKMPRRLWEDVPAFRKRMQSALGITDAVIYRPPPASVPGGMTFRTESALVVGDKARRLLGFEPVVPRERAMELTLTWARHARLV